MASAAKVGLAKFPGRENVYTYTVSSSSNNSIGARIASSTVLIGVASGSNVTIYRRGTEDTFVEVHRIDFGYSYGLSVHISYI